MLNNLEGGNDVKAVARNTADRLFEIANQKLSLADAFQSTPTISQLLSGKHSSSRTEIRHDPVRATQIEPANRLIWTFTADHHE